MQQKVIMYVAVLLLISSLFVGVASAQSEDEPLQCGYYTADEDQFTLGELSFGDCAAAVLNQMLADGLSEAYGYWDVYYVAVNDIGEVYFAENADDPDWQFWDQLQVDEAAASDDEEASSSGEDDPLQCGYFTADEDEFSLGELSFSDCAIAIFNQMVSDGLSEAYGYWDVYYVAVNDIGEVYFAETADDPDWQFWDQLQVDESADSSADISSTLGFNDTLELAATDINAFWEQTFAAQEVEFAAPDSVFFDEESVSSACGDMAASYGPFYCGGDHTVYYPVAFMVDQYSRIGDFAAVIVMAHEWGHSVQMQYGLLDSQMSIDFELQADCLAGAYANYVVTASELARLDSNDITEAMQSLFEVGDSEDTPWFDPQAHGTSEERQSAFMAGYENGLDACIG